MAGLVLLITTADGVKEVELVGGPLTVGRAATGQVCIDHASVSRAHAEIKVAGDDVLVRDLGSTNGTFVDGVRLGGQPVPLRDGSEVKFGDIAGQVKARRASGTPLARVLAADSFEDKLAAESERCARDRQSISVLALDTATASATDANIAALLRPHEVAVVRSPTRIDILAPDCDRDRATTFARRVVDRLREQGIKARIGMATWPGDVPSASSLCIAAEAALDGVTLGGFGSAQAGVRHVTVGAREIVLAEPAMIRLFGVIERLGKTDAPILIRGETGAGKEIIAEAIHSLSARAAQPLVRINCAAMPVALVESELFGHVRGAFSGADRDKTGLFEEANGGTLFLDEIGELEATVQAKLLRVLEDRRIRRVGANTEITVDVRVIAATHRDLKADAAAGRFREDLYYRLSAIVLQVPPLRERTREIAFLAERFVAEVSAGLGRKPPRLAPAAVTLLRGYPWPGNVRELRNVIQRAVVACEGDELRAEHIDLQPTAPASARPTPPSIPLATEDDTKPIDLDGDLRDLERKRIVEALERCGGNQTKAAELLGMPRRTLVYKLRALKISR